MHAAADTGRVGWIDTAKGAAILLVVLWHTALTAQMLGDFPPWLDSLNQNLASVRMPLFFLASGLLMERLVERPWEQLVRKRIAPLAWVLVLWTAIGSGIHLGVQPLPWRDIPFPEVTQVLWLPQANLWFVYALLVFTILARAAAVAGGGWQRVALAGGLWLILVGYDAWRDEFHTRNMVQYFPFFIAGVLAAGHIKRLTASWRALVVAAVMSLVGLMVLWLAGVDGLPGKAGRNVFGTGLFVVSAAALQPWPGLTRWLNAAGRNSLAIFLGHMPVLTAAYAVLPLHKADPVAVWLVLFASAIAGALLLKRSACWLGLGWLYRVPEPIADWLGPPSSRVLMASRS